METLYIYQAVLLPLPRPTGLQTGSGHGFLPEW